MSDKIEIADGEFIFDDEEMFCNISFRVLADEPPGEKEIFLLALSFLGELALENEWDLDDLLSKMFTKDHTLN